MEEVIGSEEANNLSNFLDEMPSKLSSHSPSNKNHLWVFWSHDEELIRHHHHNHPQASTCFDPSNLTNGLTIQDSIKTALCSFYIVESGDVLVQFWAPTTTTTIGGRLLLTTSHQPFALQNLTSDNLTQYRKHCLNYEFDVGDIDVVEGGEDHSQINDSPIGRVFRNELPELSPDLSYYSEKEYPQRDLALRCAIKQTLALPVFEPSRQCCVGVLELLFSRKIPSYKNFHADMAKTALKAAGLETIDTEQICKQIHMDLGHVKKEIKKALQEVCKTHHLPFACGWVRCGQSSFVDHCGSSHTSYNDSGVNCRGEFAVSIPGMSYYNGGLSYDCRQVSFLLPFRGGQGLVGKAFLSRKPFLCRDVTQLSISEYSRTHFARNSEFTGCFLVCLETIATGTRDYVLEFILSSGKTHNRHFHNLLSSVLGMLKWQLTSFEVITGCWGDELFIEVDKFSLKSEIESFKTSKCATDVTQAEPGALQNEGEVLQHLDLSDHQLVMEGLINNGVAQIESGALQNEGEVLHVDLSDDQLIMEGFINNRRDYVGPEQSEIVITSKKKCPEKKSKTDNQKKVSSCSREILEQQFGKKIDEAAESLGALPTQNGNGRYEKGNKTKVTGGKEYLINDFPFAVSRSTVKRWCRDNNIDRWPFPKKRKVISSTSITEQMHEHTQENVEPIADAGGKDLSCSNPLTYLAPTQATSTVTIKATYGNDTIKFKLSFSSRMTDLVEKVTTRTKLLDGTFSIKYLDEENEYILIACEEDLQDCMDSLRVLGKTTIRMLIEPVTDTSP